MKIIKECFERKREVSVLINIICQSSDNTPEKCLEVILNKNDDIYKDFMNMKNKLVHEENANYYKRL